MISEKNQRKLIKSMAGFLGLKLVIININYMGLGNRLKLLANYDRIWGLSGSTLIWNDTGWVNCSLKDIIEIEGVANWREMSLGTTRFLPPILCVPEHDCFWPRGYWRFHVDEDLGPEFMITRQGRVFPAVDSLYERTPKVFIDKYKQFFARLHPTPAVTARINEVEVRPEDVCVQVRNTLDPDDQASTPKLESVVSNMARYSANTKFFVSTLDSSITSVLRQAFGDRVKELPRKNYRSMIDATADMFLLSKGGELIVSEGSTFGEVAWWLGACKQTVVQLPAER